MRVCFSCVELVKQTSCFSSPKCVLRFVYSFRTLKIPLNEHLILIAIRLQ